MTLIQKILAKQLKYVRIVRGLNVYQLSVDSGIGEGTIKRLESGNSNPCLNTIECLAKALDVSPTYLIWCGNESEANECK